MKTVTIQIGNSDDKLSQAQWATFIQITSSDVHTYANKIHFSGFSEAHQPWQNACWVIEIGEHSIPRLKAVLEKTRISFGQDSIAWTEGDTVFV